MKDSSNIFVYITYKLFLLSIGIILFFGIAVMAAFTSWNYLLLYVPILLYYYGTAISDYGRKKHSELKKKKNRW